MNKSELISRIHAVWQDGDEFRLSLAILELLQKLPSANHIPMSRFHALARENALTNDPHLAHRVVQYLCGADSPVLGLGAELIDDADGIYQLKNEELQQAIQSNLNPLTGNIDDQLRNKMFVYFYPSEFAKTILMNPSSK